MVLWIMSAILYNILLKKYSNFLGKSSRTFFKNGKRTIYVKEIDDLLEILHAFLMVSPLGAFVTVPFLHINNGKIIRRKSLPILKHDKTLKEKSIRVDTSHFYILGEELFMFETPGSNSYSK